MQKRIEVEVPCPASLEYRKSTKNTRKILLTCGPCKLRRAMRFRVETSNPQRRDDPPLPDRLIDTVDLEIARCPIRRSMQDELPADA
jgi:hypothetical protein